MSDTSPTQACGLEKNRVEALVDGIFAVALTLLVLDIKLPEDATIATNGQLVARLIGLERHFVIYAISFVVIGVYWVNHHIQFHFVMRTNRNLIWINLLYALLISFLPFSTDLIGDHKELVLPCVIYGVTLLSLSATSYLHLRYLSRHPELASPELTRDVIGILDRRIAFFALVSLLSIAVSFYSTRLALYVYVLFVVAHFIPSRIDAHLARPPDRRQGDRRQRA
ncbi:MAG TPA: TMEM175 family protein [Casimicrobiaceae bacterium]|nr:TMEM175 family protein [Casimicrobiaceae bacterium]